MRIDCRSEVVQAGRQVCWIYTYSHERQHRRGRRCASAAGFYYEHEGGATDNMRGITMNKRNKEKEEEEEERMK